MGIISNKERKRKFFKKKKKPEQLLKRNIIQFALNDMQFNALSKFTLEQGYTANEFARKITLEKIKTLQGEQNETNTTSNYI